MLGLLCSVLAVAAVSSAQEKTAQRSTFDAASVRVNRSGFPGGTTDLRAGGQVRATNQTLDRILGVAYDVEIHRIIGGPDWMTRERFDVEARANTAVSRDETRLMLRSLLVERFRLNARLEPRMMPTYDLVMIRSDGSTGLGLRVASPAACVDRGPQPQRAPAGELPSCGLMPTGPERMSGRSVPIDLLVTQLSSMTGRTVVNGTNLSGLFDVDLTWAMTEAQVAQLAVLTPPGGTPPRFDPTRPGLFTAIQEQLGLRLVSSTGPVDVLVVESAERPTEN